MTFRDHAVPKGTRVWITGSSYGGQLVLESLEGGGESMEMATANWMQHVTLLTMVEFPTDLMASRKAFISAYYLDRGKTLRALMDSIVEEWLNEGRDELSEYLARWCEDGINLSHINGLLTLAESHFEEE